MRRCKTHWNHSFHMNFSYPQPVSSDFHILSSLGVHHRTWLQPDGCWIPGILLPMSALEWSEVKWHEVPQSCPTLCDPMDCSLQGSSIHGIFQARVLESVAISFSRMSALRVHQLTLGRKFWRLWHPCLLIWQEIFHDWRKSSYLPPSPLLTGLPWWLRW